MHYIMVSIRHYSNTGGKVEKVLYFSLAAFKLFIIGVEQFDCEMSWYHFLRVSVLGYRELFESVHLWFHQLWGEKLTIISSNISSVSPDTSLIPLSCTLYHLKLSHSSGMLFSFFQFFLCFVLQSYCYVFVFIFFSDTVNLVQCHFHFKKI